MTRKFFCSIIIFALMIPSVLSVFAVEERDDSSFAINALLSGNNGYVALDENGDTYYSKNPYSFVGMNNQGNSVHKVVYGHGEFIALSDETVLYSDGRARWYEFPNSITNRKVNDMIFSTSGYFVGCGKDFLIYSSDGLNWNDRYIVGVDSYNIVETSNGFMLFGKSYSGEYITVNIEGDGTFSITDMQKSNIQERLKKVVYYQGALYCVTETGSLFRFVPQLYANQPVEKLAILNDNCTDIGKIKVEDGVEKLVILSDRGDVLITEDGTNVKVLRFGNSMNLRAMLYSETNNGLFRILGSDSLGMRYFETRDFNSWKISRDIESNDGKSILWFLNENYFTNTVEVKPNILLLNILDGTGILESDDASVISSVYNSVYESVYSSVYKNNDEGTLIPPVVDVQEDQIITENPNKMDTTIKIFIRSSKMYVNGVEKKIDNDPTVQPVIIDGRTLVPIRAIMEELGGDVEWIPETFEINIKWGSVDINLAIDDKLAYINDDEEILDVPPQIISGRTFLPLRFVMESFNLNVEWDSDAGSIEISAK